MGFNRKRKRWIWVRRLFAASIACAIGALAGVYYGRVSLANYAVQKALDIEGLETLQFEFTKLNIDGCAARNLRFDSDSLTLEIDSLEMSYDISEIREDRVARDIEISGIRITYDLRGPSTLDMNEVDRFIKSGIPFPARSIQLDSVILTLIADSGPLEFDGSTTIVRDTNSAIKGALLASGTHDDLDFQFTIDDRIRYIAKYSSSNILDVLESYQPDWREALSIPSDTLLAASEASIHVDGIFHGIHSQATDIVIRSGPLSYKEPGREIDIESIHSRIQLTGEAIKDSEIRIQSTHGSINEIPFSISSINLESQDITTPVIKVFNAQWALEGGERGIFSATIEPLLSDTLDLDTFSARLSIRELMGESFEIEPFVATVRGDLNEVEISTNGILFLGTENLEINVLRVNAIDFLETDFEVSLEADLIVSDSIDPTFPITGEWKLEGAIHPNAVPISAQFELNPKTDSSVVQGAGFDVAGNATVNANLNYWPDAGDVKVSMLAKGSDLTVEAQEWTTTGMSFDLQAHAERLNIAEIDSRASAAEDLLSYLAKRVSYTGSWQGSELAFGEFANFKWLSGTVQSQNNPIDIVSNIPIQCTIQFGAGIGRFGSEEIQQIDLNLAMESDVETTSSIASGQFLFEGEPVTFEAKQSTALDSGDISSSGDYHIEGISLVSSDLLARHIDSLAGSIVNAEIELEGNLRFDESESDASATIKLREGSLAIPSQELSIESISTDFSLSSVNNLLTSGPQAVRAESITIGDLEATAFSSLVSLPKPGWLSAQDSEVTAFDGQISIDPFSISYDNPSADLVVRFNGISIAPAVAMLDFFDGTVSGRLNGSLPISLENGYPVLGEGYLELDPNSQATFSYNANGFFTNEDPSNPTPKALGDKLLETLDLEPNALLEEALGNLNINDMRLDLFSKDLPRTPMRIQLSGIANASETEIPLNITTNINGTVAELINFLTRLDSLGLVAGAQSTGN